MAGTAIRKFTRTLGANEETVLNVAGSTAVQCTSATADFTIRPDDQNPVVLANGLGIRYRENERFNTLRITNGPTAQTVEIYIGAGDVIDNRFSVSGALTTRKLAAQSSAYGNATVGTTASQIRGENTGRSSIAIQNLGPGVLYVGTDGSVTTANGLQVFVGGTLTLEVDDAIHAIASAGSTDVRYLESTA